MRILIPIHSFLPGSRFGAELYAYYLAKELAATGTDVHVFFTERQPHPSTTTYEGLPCTVLPRSASRGARALDRSNAEAETAFASLLQSFRPDIVHFNHLLHLSMELPRMAHGAQIPVVFTLHDYWLRCPKVKLFDRWGQRCVSATAFRCASCARHRYSRMSWSSGTYDDIDRGSITKRIAKELLFQMTERPAATLRIRARERELREMIPFVDRFIAPSRFLAARMEEWKIPPDRITFCDYGTMELPYAAPARRKGVPPLRFGYLGAVSPEKGLHVLLEAFRDIHDAQLVIYGSTADTLRARYPQFADVIGQPNVQPAGSIDDAQKIQVLPNLDALIVPSVWYENSPVVIHEAFQAGVPVICSNTGGMAELVTDDVDGAHFAVGSASDLQNVLRACVVDPDRLARWASRIQKPIGMKAHVVDEIRPIYELLQKRNRSAATVSR